MSEPGLWTLKPDFMFNGYLHIVVRKAVASQAELQCISAQVSMLSKGMSHDIDTDHRYYESHGTERCATEVHHIIQKLPASFSKEDTEEPQKPSTPIRPCIERESNL